MYFTKIIHDEIALWYHDKVIDFSATDTGTAFFIRQIIWCMDRTDNGIFRSFQRFIQRCIRAAF